MNSWRERALSAALGALVGAVSGLGVGDRYVKGGLSEMEQNLTDQLKEVKSELAICRDAVIILKEKP